MKVRIGIPLELGAVGIRYLSSYMRTHGHQLGLMSAIFEAE